MPYEEYKGKLYESWKSQIDGGLVYFIVTRGLAVLLLYIVVFVCVLYFHGRAYVQSRHEAYWIASALFLASMSFGSAALNFYSLKRRIAKLSQPGTS